MLDRSNPYFHQVALVVRVLPLVAPELGFNLYARVTEIEPPTPTPIPTPDSVAAIPTTGAYGLIVTALGLVIVASGCLSRRKTRER